MIIFNARLTVKKLKQHLLIILLSLSFTAVALPPDMQADRYLVQVEKALKVSKKAFIKGRQYLNQKNFNQYGKYVMEEYDARTKAIELMDKIMALKDKHNLELPIDFYFKYAKIVLGSIDSNNRGSKAYTAINHYLQTAGKTGKHYKEALVLYDLSLSDRLSHAKTANQVKQLIELGADVNAKGVAGIPPLYYYVTRYNPDIVKVIKALIQAGADVNAKSEPKGRTPLHYAVMFENQDIIKVLIQAGADVNVKTRHTKKTPLDFLRKDSRMNKDEKAKIKRWLKNPSLLR